MYGRQSVLACTGATLHTMQSAMQRHAQHGLCHRKPCTPPSTHRHGHRKPFTPPLHHHHQLAPPPQPQGAFSKSVLQHSEIPRMDLPAIKLDLPEFQEKMDLPVDAGSPGSKMDLRAYFSLSFSFSWSRPYQLFLFFDGFQYSASYR